MDLVRGSVLITTLLHCVLACSHPSNDGSVHNYGSYNVSPIPEIRTLPIPSNYDKIPQTIPTPTFVVNPSWHNRLFMDNPELGHEKLKSSVSHSYKPELPGTVLKGFGLKYPLTMPRVKLNFIGTSGMLPVKKIHDTSSNNHEPHRKVMKPASSDLAKLDLNDKFVGRVPLYKNTQIPISKPNQYEEQIMKTANDNSAYHNVLYGQKEQPLQLTPSYPPELLGYLNPTNYPPTNPGIYYGKDQEVLKPIQYRPLYKYELPSLGFGLDSADMGYLTSTGANYEKIEEQDKNAQYTSTYKPFGIEALKPTSYLPTNPGVYYGEVNQPDKAIQYTPSYRTYVPEIAALKYPFPKTGIHGSYLPVDINQHILSYKGNLPLGVLKPSIADYAPTMPTIDKENKQVIKLPPVPTTMSLLQRTQLALLNTVAGLPGGNPQALDSVRVT